MATTVYTTEEYKLGDGTEVELKPLNIKRLRKFQKLWNAYLRTASSMAEEIKAEEERAAKESAETGELVKPKEIYTDDDFTDMQMDYFTQMLEVCLAEYRGGKEDDSYRNWIEDCVDEQTMYKIFEVCGNLKLNDPKLMEAARAAVQDGMN